MKHHDTEQEQDQVQVQQLVAEQSLAADGASPDLQEQALQRQAAPPLRQALRQA